jgi:hypothetical protein
VTRGSPISYLESSVLLNHSNFLRSNDKLSQELDYLQASLHKEDEFLKTLSEAYEIDLTELRHSPHVFPGRSVYLKDGKESRSISLDMLALNSFLCLLIPISFSGWSTSGTDIYYNNNQVQ